LLVSPVESQFPENRQKQNQDKKRCERDRLDFHDWVLDRDVVAAFDVKIDQQNSSQQI
jgi:hypothetical protein